MNINIGTFNILDPDFALRHKQSEGMENGYSNWGTRKDRMVQLIKDSNLDVVCLQEVSAQSFNDLKGELEKLGYTCVHTPHSGRKDGLAILYKKNFKPIHYANFTKADLDSCYLDLQDQTTKKIIRVANCHLLGGGKPEGTAQIENLVNQVEKSAHYNIDARIIVGDFNEDQTKLNLMQSKFTALKNANYVFDGNISPTEPGKNRKIDWIWLKSSAAQIVPFPVPQPFIPVSDHTLCASRVTLIPTGQPVLGAQALPPVPSPMTVTSSPVYKHNQPPGSFRCLIMENFEVTGWDDALHTRFKIILDNFLSDSDGQKRQNPALNFLNLVRQHFAFYVNGLYMTDQQKNVLREDLDNAIRAAATAQKIPEPALPTVLLIPSPSPVPVPPSLKAYAKPEAPNVSLVTPTTRLKISSIAQVPPKNATPQAANPPTPKAHPFSWVVALGRQIKAFFRRIGNFVNKLFKTG